mgnify:CR=1 FL=1
MKKQNGFTLLEIMVVVVIMGLLASVVATNVMGSKEEASIQKAQIDIKSLDEALEMYKLDNHKYPTTEQGLDALVNKPTSSPEPWDNDYVYIYPGVHNNRGFDIYSMGPDGEPETDDDIGNWKDKDRK